MLGGNLYSLMPYGVSCWQAFRDNKDSFWNRRIALTNVVLKLSELFVDQGENPQQDSLHTCSNATTH